MKEFDDITDLAERIKGGDRTALSRGITLLESSRNDHREMAMDLLRKCRPDERPVFRICIAGAPGAGKSSFIEEFGLLLAQQGDRIAVLTIDPSSQISKGSVLGDKTRMSQLAKHPDVFVRPSPNRQEMGGITPNAYEILTLFESAGFDFIIVETVGTGQSEYTGKYIADFFILLISPGDGDEIQSMKRGIIESADMVVVTKADGKLKQHAQNTAHIYEQAQSGHRRIPVFTCSSKDKSGFLPIWENIRKVFSDNRFIEDRKESKVLWLNNRWKEAIFQKAKKHYNRQVNELETKVKDGSLTIPEAVQKFLVLIFANRPD